MPTALSIVKAFFPQVDKVVDGTKRITVHVSEADAKTSTKKNHSRCALAVACKNQEQADGVIVSLKTVYVVKGRRAFRYENLESSSREIVSFDRAGGFEPGDYQIRPPTKKLGAPSYTKAHGRNRGDGESAEKRFKHRTTNIRASINSTTGGA